MPEPLAALHEFRTLDVTIEETEKSRSGYEGIILEMCNRSNECLLMLTSSARRCRREKFLAIGAMSIKRWLNA
ncbi:hypothetical protein DPMN_049686 [Dreissena polymorpha]|uniref:Uncharacterized protein n=1 Tax=Dreissena polymorpha TaxID=45954 RepID=A0A9D4CGD0_DREPO|nr:hypothetical protein DPMN_049686 [Dreissena polymorpha]